MTKQSIEELMADTMFKAAKVKLEQLKSAVKGKEKKELVEDFERDFHAAHQQAVLVQEERELREKAARVQHVRDERVRAEREQKDREKREQAQREHAQLEREAALNQTEQDREQRDEASGVNNTESDSIQQPLTPEHADSSGKRVRSNGSSPVDTDTKKQRSNLSEGEDYSDEEEELPLHIAENNSSNDDAGDQAALAGSCGSDVVGGSGKKKTKK